MAYESIYRLHSAIPEENPKTVRLNGGEFVQLSRLVSNGNSVTNLSNGIEWSHHQ